MNKILKKYWQYYLLLLPALIYVFIFRYMPMYGIQIAFKEFSGGLGIWKSPWVGFSQFIRFISYPRFTQLLWNTISINLYSLAVAFPAPIILALLINEIRHGFFKKFAQMVTYAPHFISTVVLCGMVILFTNKDAGILNHLLDLVGFSRISFMTEPGLFKSIYVLSGVWQNTGWGTILYIAVLSNVSPELIDAARIDGANRFQVMWYINIPAILPTVTILLILNVGGLLGLGFEKIYLLQNALNLSSSEVISTYVYKIGLLGAQFSYSTAIGLFNTICNLILLIIMNTISRKISEVALW